MRCMAIKAMLALLALAAFPISASAAERTRTFTDPSGEVRCRWVLDDTGSMLACQFERINKIAWIFPGDPAEVTGASREDGLEDSLFPAARRLKAGASWISPDERFVCRTKTPGKPGLKLGCTRFDSSDDIDGGFLAMRRSIKTF